MITKIDWYCCSPNTAWETQIHQTLQTLSEIRPISYASLRVEEEKNSAEPFHLTLMLSMPGPDVLVHGRGHSLLCALQQLNQEAWEKLAI